jgi:hypothetical protein
MVLLVGQARGARAFDASVDGRHERASAEGTNDAQVQNESIHVLAIATSFSSLHY